MSKFAAMTVNERLAEANLFEDWDEAVRACDRDRMIKILQRVDMGDLAFSTADAVLADPERYGYFKEDGHGPPRAK
ncbi:hypothetical protein [Phenylobacterium sp.]|uniref:hypothetical protein n=1 Tax=Phenylobacterium sp. TaxID=1871053 RepID=UPI002C94A3FE|nr:hypothetical protein [Phenylobacterium sp.]HVI31221.1 hypothetical protein [Phenylobacterium sp.]